jgi:hypothetical protein
VGVQHNRRLEDLFKQTETFSILNPACRHEKWAE